MNATRVVYVINNLRGGGSERHLVRLTGELARTGRWDISVYCLSRGGTFLPDMEERGIPVAGPVRPWSWRPWNLVRSVLDLQRHLRREKPAIVECYLVHAGLVGAVAARLARVPHVITTRRGISTSGRPVGDFHYYYDRAAQAIADRLSDAIIAVSDAAASAAVQQGTPKEKLVTVHNSVPLPAAPAERAALFEGDPIIGAVGSFYQIKGHRFLIDAAAHVLAQLPRARFILVGDGIERSNLERQVAQLGVADRVTFLGHRTDVGRLLPEFDIFVLPSLSEGMPNAVLEAMAAGVPVVATDVGGVPEVVEQERTGLLVPPGNAGALAAALVRLAEDANLRSRMSACARGVVETNFSLEREAQETENVYHRLLGRTLPEHSSPWVTP